MTSQSKETTDMVEIDRETLKELTRLADGYLVKAEQDGADGYAQKKEQYVRTAQELLEHDG